MSEEIEHLKTELAKIKAELVNLRDNYCSEGAEEVRDILNKLIGSTE